MLQRRPSSFGFTLIELLIVLGVFAVLAVMIAPALTPTVASRDLETSAATATDALRRAQANVMTGRDFTRWGVHFQADRFVLFSGAAYSAGNADNIVTVLSGEVRVTAVSLSPGGACAVATGIGNCDVHFAMTEGMPTEPGTVTMTSANETRTITVNAAGMTAFQ